MIASVRGKLLHKQPEYVIVEVGGMGLKLLVPLSTYYEIPDVGEKLFLFTHLIVREDLMRLFGFGTRAELEMFEVLIDINRIGPKLALSILSGVTATDLKNAVLLQDFSVLTAIPGIGKKSAERILFEVRDKLEKLGQIESRSEGMIEGIAGKTGAEVVGVLVNLGYKNKDAERAVSQLISGHGDKLSVDEMIRMALKKLAGR